MANQAKLVRGQLRQLIQEMLPDLMKQALYEQLQKENEKRLIQIAKNVEDVVSSVKVSVKDTLDKIDARAKDIQDFTMRTLLTPPAEAKVQEQTPKE